MWFSVFSSQQMRVVGGENQKYCLAVAERVVHSKLQCIYKGGGSLLTQPRIATTEAAVHSVFQSLYKGV
jgi:hypothetical protein